MLSTRKRKDAVESEIKVQVCVFAFDLLYLNGESMVRKNFGERRDLLRENFKEIEGEFFYAKVRIFIIHPPLSPPLLPYSLLALEVNRLFAFLYIFYIILFKLSPIFGL